jgi:hypothetical protein
MPAFGFQQTPSPKTTLTVKGFSGSAPVIRVNGKSYVEIESLARITNGSLSFQANQIVFAFASQAATPAGTASPVAQEPIKPATVSKDIVKAGIDETTAIEEWRTAIVKAVQSNSSVTPDWVDGYQRNANSKFALASAAVVGDPDRDVLQLLRDEFNNMKTLSDKYLALRKDMTYTASDSLDTDPLNQKVQNCARGLAALTPGSQFQDVAVCH